MPRYFTFRYLHRLALIFGSFLIAACIGPGTETTPTTSAEPVVTTSERAQVALLTTQTVSAAYTETPPIATPFSPIITPTTKQIATTAPSPISSTSLPRDLEIIEPGIVDRLQAVARLTINTGGYRSSDPAFSPDGRILEVASGLGEVVLSDLENLEILRILETILGRLPEKR